MTAPVDTSAEAVERLAKGMDGLAAMAPWKDGYAPRAAATLRALAAERDTLRAELDECRHGSRLFRQWNEAQDALLNAARERDTLRAALDPFARIWRINARLAPDPARPVAHFIAGAWPIMADAKRAADALKGPAP